MKTTIFFIVCVLSNQTIFAQNALTFLENYGYLSPSKDNEMNLISSDEYRRAVLRMQKFTHLPMTGVVDKALMDKMNEPRCGMPDYETFKHKRSKRFVTYGSKWTSNLITWSLVRESSKISSETIRQQLRNAFQIWSEGSRGILMFKELDDGDMKANIKISFYAGEHGCGTRNSFDGPGKKLAHAFAPTKGDIHFDDDENWNGDKEHGVSLFWTAVHEIGHSLGFAHTANEHSIMFPYYQNHEGRFKLPSDDQDGIRFLYGSDSPFTNLTTDKPQLRPTDAPNSGTKTKPDKDEPLKVPCNTNIDAIATIRSDIFVFKNNIFWWIKANLEMVRPEPSLISSYFIDFPQHIQNIDAVYERRIDQKIVFFVNDTYYIFDANTLFSGPNPLSDYGLYDSYGEPIKKIDAIFNWGHSGRTFIFARDSYGESLYWRLNEREDRTEKTYPRHVSTTWVDVPTPVDAAFTWSYDSGTYFFKANEFFKFNNDEMQIDHRSKRFIQDFWFRQIYCPKASALTNFSSGSSMINFTDKLNYIFVILIHFIMLVLK